jgi:hypothetical protein
MGNGDLRQSAVMPESTGVATRPGVASAAGRPPETPAGESSDLTVEQILAWADAYHAEHGAWPAVTPGSVTFDVPSAPRESWKAINLALAMGFRGLPGDSSLAELLAARRGAPLPDMGPGALAEKIWAWEREQFPLKRPRFKIKGLPGERPPLAITEILAWADAHREATGKWPSTTSGRVQAAPYRTSWCKLNTQLRNGGRGLPGGSSLRQVLAEHRPGDETRLREKTLGIEQILAWADAHHAATGQWPNCASGPVKGAPPHTTWASLNENLSTGHRGLPGGSSLREFLATHRPAARIRLLQPLLIEQILAWADAHHAATGQWPTTASGPVRDARSAETWAGLCHALRDGFRGLTGGTTLGRLLRERRGVLPATMSEPLAIEQILAWADAHHAATGKWPTTQSGSVRSAPEAITWMAIDKGLRIGTRGLPRGSSLRLLLAEHRAVLLRMPLPAVTAAQILAWADAHRAATGKWPNKNSGQIQGAPDAVTWKSVSFLLYHGRHGLPKGRTLAGFLAEHRPADSRRLEPVSIEQILAWADAHHAATGAWPDIQSGVVREAPYSMTWLDVDRALRTGIGGLPGGTMLSRLLADRRPVVPRYREPLSVEQILAWADAHRAATGKWPNASAGQVRDVPFALTWSAVNGALDKGGRGLPGGSSLRRLLREQRQVRGRQTPEELGIEQIVAWAEAHHAAVGTWPSKNSGPVRAAHFRIDWSAIDGALRGGKRGLPGGSSLSGLLAEHCPAGGARTQPPLAITQILAWAEAHHAATGQWPTFRSGPVSGAAAPLTWGHIDDALRNGHRGLPGGASLSALLVECRQARRRMVLEPISKEQIVAWAEAHLAATGKWPTLESGLVQAAPFPITWVSVNLALTRGIRGLPRGSSLARVLAEHRGSTRTIRLAPLTEEQIAAWAEAYHAAHDRWPAPRSGAIPGYAHVTWRSVDRALRKGYRGLPGGSSLSRLLAEHPGAGRTCP